MSLEMMVSQMTEALKDGEEYKVYSEDVSFNFTTMVMLYLRKEVDKVFGDDKVNINFDPEINQFSAITQDKIAF